MANDDKKPHVPLVSTDRMMRRGTSVTRPATKLALQDLQSVTSLEDFKRLCENQEKRNDR